jgi:hypothetical protein
LFRSKDLISKVGGVDSKDSSDLGFYYLFSKGLGHQALRRQPPMGGGL